MANHLLSVNLQNFLINSAFYANVQAIGGAKNIYIFSQQGYAMLVKLLKSKLAKKIYKQMVRGYFGIKKAIFYEDGYNREHINQNATHPRHNIALSNIAKDEIYLEKIFGKRTKMLETFGYCTSQAAVKASDSIRKDIGIDLMERLQIRSCETDCRGFIFPNEQCKKETQKASAPLSPKEIHVKDTQDVSVFEQIHKAKDVSDTQIPKTYRGWNLNRRGKNKNGEETFNLVRKINGKRYQKYLGVWNQEKADQFIDELNRKYSHKIH